MSNARRTIVDFRITVGKKPSPLTLSAKDVLKLTFQVVEGKDGKGVHPHQTFLRFYDEVTKEEGIQPIRVNADGKAKFELVCFFDFLLNASSSTSDRIWQSHLHHFHPLQLHL